MIYIPASLSEINLIAIPASGSTPAVTPEEQWTKLNTFIEGDKYLSKHRGQYAERNAARLPFMNVFDFRLLQEFKIKVGNSTNKLQLSFDILNVGNMLNKKWGHYIYASNQQWSIINYKGQTATTKPTFTYDGGGQTKGNAYSLSDFSSRWRGQLGIRYIFN
jgi:hypothetical protein